MSEEWVCEQGTRCLVREFPSRYTSSSHNAGGVAGALSSPPPGSSPQGQAQSSPSSPPMCSQLPAGEIVHSDHWNHTYVAWQTGWLDCLSPIHTRTRVKTALDWTGKHISGSSPWSFLLKLLTICRLLADQIPLVQFSLSFWIITIYVYSKNSFCFPYTVRLVLGA